MKRLFLAVSIALALCSSAWAQPVLKDKVIDASPDGDQYTTTNINSTGANICIVHIGNYPGAGGDNTFTDTVGATTNANTWTPLTTRTQGGVLKIAGYYVVSPVVGANHHLEITSGTRAYPAVDFRCYSGITTLSTFDVESGSTATAVHTQPVGSLSPSSSSNLVIAAITFVASVSSVTLPGYTDLNFINAGVDVGLAVGAKLGGLSGTESPTFSWTSDVDVAASDVSFKASGGGGGGGSVPNALSLMGVGH